jgi:hypothetical protein
MWTEIYINGLILNLKETAMVSKKHYSNISENEERHVSWEFTATFDPLLQTELVRIVNEHREVSIDYIDGLLNRNIIQSSKRLTFAVPLDIPSLISTPAVHVAGVLKHRSQIRRRTDQEVLSTFYRLCRPDLR